MRTAESVHKSAYIGKCKKVEEGSQTNSVGILDGMRFSFLFVRKHQCNDMPLSAGESLLISSICLPRCI